MAWRWSVCGTAEVVWKPRFLWQWPSAHLHLVSCFSFSSWQYPIDSLWGSGLVSLLASKAHQHHGHLTNFWQYDNPHNAAVLSVGCASFSSTLFPSTQLSVNMLGYSTLWTASFFGNECLWLTLLVKGVNDCLLDNCQISSLPHDCVA